MRYIQLYAAFEDIDQGNDHRIDLNEFRAGLDLLRNWGIDVTNVEQEFSLIDSNDGGQILFEEFCMWAIQKGLDYDKSFEIGDENAKLQAVNVRIEPSDWVQPQNDM